MDVSNFLYLIDFIRQYQICTPTYFGILYCLKRQLYRQLSRVCRWMHFESSRASTKKWQYTDMEYRASFNLHARSLRRRKLRVIGKISLSKKFQCDLIDVPSHEGALDANHVSPLSTGPDSASAP